MTNSTNQPSGDQDKDFVTELQSELREMGKQLEAAFRATVESDQAKRVQSDLAAGVRELTNQVRTTVEHLQTNPRVQEAEERSRQAFTQARETKVVQEMQELLVTGIGQINLQLRKFVERMNVPPTSSSPTVERVDIEQPPATGETTRLDE